MSKRLKGRLPKAKVKIVVDVTEAVPFSGYLKEEPPRGTLPTGEVVYVDDGTCAKGEVKEVTGGSIRYSIPREYRCVKRPWPWPIQQVDKVNVQRILTSDPLPGEYLTLDKKGVVIDHVTRWRIIDPFKFLRTRLDDIVLSELREEIASREFASLIAEEREPTMEAVATRVAEKAREFGIEVVDVRVKRLSRGTFGWD